MSLHNYIHWLDYGVKGQKRGQHIKARDPEYLARLKGGLGSGKISKVDPMYGSYNHFKRTGRLDPAINMMGARNTSSLKRLIRETERLKELTKPIVEPEPSGSKRLQEKRNLRQVNRVLRRGVRERNKNAKEERAIQKAIEQFKQSSAEASENRVRAAEAAQRQRAKQAHYANVRNELSSKAERPTGYKQKSMLRRIGNGLSKHKGKAALAGLGLAAIGGGLGYAKHRGAFDSNYNVLKFRRKDSMNINQKIKFLKFRRHMDAMRIKRLKRRLDLGVVPATILGLTGSVAIGSLIGAVMAKVMNKLNYDNSIDRIYAGKALPEKDYVKAFQVYFTKNSSNIGTRFMEPGYWGGVNAENYKDYLKKVNSAKTVNDLIRIFPDHAELKKIAAAYKAARASGLY